MNTRHVIVAFAAFIAGPITADAVPVTWEARGSVEFSDLGSGFFASFMAELAGTSSAT
jgi:hypothetical protein